MQEGELARKKVDVIQAEAHPLVGLNSSGKW